MAELEQPIIIKKIYRVEGGHHGGAWKVAYADFVTAMMAFFLLLWLLSTSTDATLEGLAEYFTPTIGLKDQMGIGFEGGEAPMEDGTKKDIRSPVGIVVGSTPQGPLPTTPKEAEIEAMEDAKLFEQGEVSMKQAFESDPNLTEFKDNIVVEQTPEGLKIELIDSGKDSMFVPGSANLTEFGQRLLAKMVPFIEQLPNHISVTGHTDVVPASSPQYTNWELSADRANAARRYFLRNGMDVERVVKVVGRAAEELLLPDEPKNPKNRRISVILLRGSHLEIPLDSMPAPRSLLSVPSADSISREEGGSSGGNYTGGGPKTLDKIRNLRLQSAPPKTLPQLPVDALQGTLGPGDDDLGTGKAPPKRNPVVPAPAPAKPAPAAQ